MAATAKLIEIPEFFTDDEGDDDEEGEEDDDDEEGEGESVMYTSNNLFFLKVKCN